MGQTTPSTSPRASFLTFKLLGLALILAAASSCTPPPPPPPVNATLTEIQTDISRGGRMVAVSVYAGIPGTAIAAGESGGLFRTTDGGSTWRHIDAFPAFRMVDVAFAVASSPDPKVVFATTIKDAQTDPSANYGGAWVSRDAGLTWSHIVPDHCPAPYSAHGIAFYAYTSVFIAADCGLLYSEDQGRSWILMPSGPARAVAAQEIGGRLYIDICSQGGGHRRSIDIGVTWSVTHGGPTCETAHSLAASPLESNVLFATAGSTLLESDDGGQTWTTDLRATAYNERPVWVRTRRAIDNDPTHFDLYFPGRRVTCTNNSAGPRCPSNAGETWARVPDSPLNHDINGLTFDPHSNCPMLMAADYGVYRMGNPTAASPCGGDATWTHVGRTSNGLGSLQLYQVAGQLHYPLSGDVATNGYTNIFIGTMDNWLWVNRDAGPVGWRGFGIEGSYLQTIYEAPLAPETDLQVTYIDFGMRGKAQKIVPNLRTNSWSSPADWTAVTPPGNGTAPVIIAPHTYVQWSGNTLFLTTDGGITWSTLATMPAHPSNPSGALQINRYGSSQVSRSSAGPVLFEYVTDGSSSGLVFSAHLSATATPRVMEIRTFAGKNNLGFSSGLGGIYGNCFGSGAFYCQPVYAVDPNDYRNLIAADPVQKIMAKSTDAGKSWKPDFALTRLVTANGALSFTDSIGGCQAHVIAYDPGNSAHILVGTDQAGIIASSDGGQTWVTLPGTNPATAISSIFFDDRANVVYIATYGRGLWRLTVDWSTF